MSAHPPVPAKSPFQLGARVQLHGYGGLPAGHRRTGFRGVVTGGFGTNALWIRADADFDVVENWSLLVAEGAPNDSAASCTCCPRRRVTPARAEQLDLLEATV